VKPAHTCIPLLFFAALALTCAAKKSSESKECQVSYEKTGRAVDPKTKWSYFLDVVTEVTVDEDGAAWVAFVESSRRFRLAPGDANAGFLKAAQASLASGSKVHVAVDESGSSGPPKPGGEGGAPAKLVWVDPEKQHPSCR
jgi:hypothetical protein